MAYVSTAIRLSVDERSVLERNVRAAKTEQRLALRSRIVLLAADGVGTNAIAAQLRVSPATVSKWRLRFARQGLEGLRDAPRSGAPGRYSIETERRILAKLDEPVPEGETTWTARLLARALGDVSEDHVWRIFRRHGIHLQRRRSWCLSTDPEFAAKAADIVGLYLAPPEKALVICVDEKPQIQALERAQGYLRFSDGQTFTGFSDRYKRHGTTTLFGALEVASGLVSTGHYKRRRRIEFLDFMNQLVRQYPEGQEIHVILDNLSTHSKKGGTWLARHPHGHFHFTPTNASWLNQIEIWFGILRLRVLRGGSFISPRDLRGAIDRFTSAWCEDCSPFVWTKESVQQVTLKRRYSDLCK
ncbi:MAG: IS630 family transposase [Thermoleophilia bacterium]